MEFETLHTLECEINMPNQDQKDRSDEQIQRSSHIRTGSFSRIPLPPKPLPSLPNSPTQSDENTNIIKDTFYSDIQRTVDWGLDTEVSSSIEEYRGYELQNGQDKSPSQLIWIWYCYLITWFLPTCLLFHFPKWFNNDKRIIFAWREKIALCSIILWISMIFAFITFIFSDLICDPKTRIEVHQLPNNSVIIYGNVYDASPSSPLWKEKALYDLFNIAPLIYGHSINNLFYEISSAKCPLIANPITATRFISLPTIPYPIQMQDISLIDTSPWIDQAYIGQFSILWNNIEDNDQVFVYNGRVYTFDPDLLGPVKSEPLTMILNNTIKSEFPFILGKDATRDILASNNQGNLYSYLPCFHPNFIIAYADTSQPGCVVSQIITGTFLVILVMIILIKFIAAVIFSWILGKKIGKIQKTPPFTTKTPPFVIVMMTCYSEGKESLKATLDSAVATIYPDDRKLLLVIADGLVKGAGNDQSTPNILYDLIDTSFNWKIDNSDDVNIISYSYESLHGLNEAKVITGLYKFEGRSIPVLLIVKCGTAVEQLSTTKPGNRGKRDSQLIMMKFFSNLTMLQQDPHVIKQFSYLDHAFLKALTFILKDSDHKPQNLEYVLMVDADTRLEYDSLNRLMAAMIRDQNLMGCCGETKIFNKDSNWVTRIQVFEYHINHHLSKGFESVFGGVTCLPGCFSLYRLKINIIYQYDKISQDYRTKYRQFIHGQSGHNLNTKIQKCYPLLVHPDIIDRYGECIDDPASYTSIHKRNLLHLGEDRYLTTLLLSQFPKRKLVFVPNAICRTVVPDKFSVLLSQRRRWINSTVHNLLQLLKVRGLCGAFCCSMHFVILLELLGAILLPACVLSTYYLLFMLIVFKDDRVILSLALTLAILLLQAILIMFTSCKWSYLKWMIYYVFAIPIWNFIFPCYAFWHFDDFSWGHTRKIE